LTRQQSGCAREAHGAAAGLRHKSLPGATSSGSCGFLKRTRLRPWRAYALVEVRDSEAIDIFLRREDADAFLAAPQKTSRTGKMNCALCRSSSTSNPVQRTSSCEAT